MTEINEHCQCDNCSGRDCGQDDPDKYAAEREALEKQHDEQVRKEEKQRIYALIDSDERQIRKEEQERVLKKLVEKIDSCILSCPEDARQKPKTMLMYFRKTCESLIGAP